MANQTIIPVGHRLLVRYVEAQEQMQGGILLPDTITKEKPNAATVLAVGSGFVGPDGHIPLPLNINVGDTVLLTRHAGVEVKSDGVKCHLITPEDILAILV